MASKGRAVYKLSVAVASVLTATASLAPTESMAGSSQGVKSRPSASAIIGTGSDAIIGTGADAIIGTGSDAIIGTGADAIIGTGSDAIIGTGADALIRPTTYKSVAAMGPIDSIDLRKGTVSVMGRTLSLGKGNASLLSFNEALSAGKTVQVRIVASIGKDGSLTQARLDKIPGEYVAGVSDVVVSGKVTKVSANVGKITVGGVSVDYTPLLAKQAVTVRVGDLVSVVGTRMTVPGEVSAKSIGSISN